MDAFQLFNDRGFLFFFFFFFFFASIQTEMKRSNNNLQ